MSKPNEKTNNTVNAIGQGSIINGHISTEGDLRIDGTLTVSITTKGRLVLGEGGLVEGNVFLSKRSDSRHIKGKNPSI